MSLSPVIEEQVELSAYNTLKVSARAHRYTEAASVDELRAALGWARREGLDTLVLGGGSNLVIAGDVSALVIRMTIRERSWCDVEGDEATLVLGAGENWHEAVLYAAAAGYRGIENLALIPGTAGAAPVQNIGAYGVELADTLVSLAALDTHTDEVVELKASDCRFGYRDSLFKQQSGRYIILMIRLRLCRSYPFSLSYGELANYFPDQPGAEALTPLAVAHGVEAIRRRKLPDPLQLPNAGSFFKNPVVDRDTWQRLRASHPQMVAYPAGESMKLAAGWLIDQCGWKGYRNSHVGVHNHQALVLVNHGGGSGRDVLELAERIRRDVRETFGVDLEVEPRIVSG